MSANSYTQADPRASTLAGARAWFTESGLTRPLRGKNGRGGSRWIAGVSAGIARRYEWNPLVVRLLVIASFILPGPGLLAYVALWILMPRDPHADA